MDTINLVDLQTYLLTEFPGVTLMPSTKTGKLPKYKHKNNQYTSHDFLSCGHKECEDGCIMVLTKDIVVIDVDDETYCDTFENASQEFTHTVCCKTRKGKHYYFRSTPKSLSVNMKDGARQMKLKNGEVLPIDIKTVTSTGTGGVISIPPSPNKQWIRKLGQCDILPLPDTFVDFYTSHIVNKHTESTTSKTCQTQITCHHVSREEVQHLVQMLDKRRADNYHEWIQLGWCLHNLDVSFIDIWIGFSSESDKYKEGECERLWSTMRNEGIGMGSLRMWAKSDSPSEYANLMNERMFSTIKNCNGSHHSIAEIAFNILGKSFVCASPGGRLWYHFNGTLWEQDHEAIRLRNEISTKLKQQFIMVLQKLRMIDSENVSSASSANTNQEVCERILRIIYKLEDYGFKESLVKEMREQFFDKDFLNSLDANPNLIAFTNGVWDLKRKCFRNAVPDDMLSLCVGYPYIAEEDTEIQAKIKTYFERLHPIHEQRQYVLKMFARQMYGDNGSELFHIHSGFKGSAGNGKSKFFEVLELAFGKYVHKFAVETLVAKQRSDPNKPCPEFANWKGRRILYCSEPNTDDKLNCGIMKELTGGESISYRLLFCNQIHEFHPMYKMHIMCNDTPRIDGSDEGVKRRIRKVDYIARFVDADQVDESVHMYLKDMGFIENFKRNLSYRMELLRFILDHYDHTFAYEMPEIIKKNSAAYIDDNNCVLQFTNEHVVVDRNQFFTLKEAKEMFKSSEFYDTKVNLKTALERLLGTQCINQKKINNVKYKNVFDGYRLYSSDFNNSDDEIDV